MEKHLISENKGGHLIITLNRPEKMNAIGIGMIRQLGDVLKAGESDKDVRAIIVAGKGDRSFSAGGDLKEFESLDKQGTIDWIQTGHKTFNLLENTGKPTIAAISGYCLGGGLELAMACDFRIAAGNAVFGSPELKHGWIPGWGGLTRLRRLIGESRAKEVILLSENFDALKAYKMGLLYKVTEVQYLMDESIKLATQLSNIDPMVFEMAKRALMDPQYGTNENSRMYDVLATLYSKFMVNEGKS